MRTLRRLFNLIRLRKLEADLAEEIEFHRAMKRRELEAAGLSHQDAAAAAARALGNVTMAREDARAVWLWPLLESVLQDVGYAVRTLRRQPGFAVVAIGMLAAGIGLNASVFAVFSAAALRPWPVRDPGRVVNLYRLDSHVPAGMTSAVGFSIAEARFLDASSRALTGVVAMRQADLQFESDAVARLSNAMIVTGNYFRVLGVEMERGRGFIPDEDTIQAPKPVAVLSYLAWQNRFSGDPDIVGRPIRLDNVPFVVVGVASRDFAGTASLRTDVWIPFGSLPVLRPLDASIPDLLTRPDYCCSAVTARLGPGINRDQARAELELLSRAFHQPSTQQPSRILITDTAMLSHPGTKTQARAVFGLMFAGVMLVLLLTCANVGNLLIARAAARQREIATRLSLGASRLRIVRQLLTESLVLGCVAAFVGIAIAYILPSYLLAHAVRDPLNLHVRADALVLGVSVGLSMLACILTGLAPALHATALSLAHAMKEQGFASRLRLRSLLLSVQVGASVMLLVSAGLMVRGVQHAYALDPGFAISSLEVVSFDVPAAAYNPARVQTLLSDLDLALSSVPTLTRYGLARTAPFANGHWFTSVHLAGEDKTRDRLIESQEVGAGYFAVLGLPIAPGRDFEPSDAARGAILINQTMARRYFGDVSPIGKAIVVGNGAREIVGVVKDAYTTGLDSIEPLVYEPVSGNVMPQLLMRKTSIDEAQIIAGIVKRLDPRIHVRVEPLTAQLDRYLSPARTGAVLAGTLGLLALVLATVGMFGVFAYVVRQRTREIGIRMALGARPRQIVRLVLGASCRPVMLGLVLGLIASLAASHVMRRWLYGLSGLDLAGYAAICTILGVAAIGATWAPARRAIRVDPVRALHDE